MKKILFLLLFIPSLTFGQFLRLPYSYLLHNYQGDTIKQYFSGDSAKWYTDKGFFSFGRPIFSAGKKLITTTDTTNKWLPKTSPAVNSNLFQNHDSVYYNLSLTRKIKASDTARWGTGGLSLNDTTGGSGNKKIGTTYGISQKLGLHATADNSALIQGKDTTWIKAQGGGSTIYANSGLYRDGDTIKFGGVLINNTNDNSIQITNNSTGTGIYTDNNSTGYSNFISNNSTGYGIVIRNATTGIPFKIVNNSNVDKFIVDKDGVIEITTVGEGIILKSPDGTRYKITVANGGTLTVTAQ